ncbi:hypothetical protein Bbelb_051950 [Branchiostoma belcheri]|nr:hypothetical protein Bbelb_051950 [Branchiostoma belcheri]
MAVGIEDSVAPVFERNPDRVVSLEPEFRGWTPWSGGLHLRLTVQMAEGQARMWSNAETQCLLAIWSRRDIQSKLDFFRNKDAYRKIAAEMTREGYKSTPDQVVRDANKKTVVVEELPASSTKTWTISYATDQQQSDSGAAGWPRRHGAACVNARSRLLRAETSRNPLVSCNRAELTYRKFEHVFVQAVDAMRREFAALKEKASKSMCLQCNRTFQYQEYDNGIMNYNNSTFLSLQLCLCSDSCVDDSAWIEVTDQEDKRQDNQASLGLKFFSIYRLANTDRTAKINNSQHHGSNFHHRRTVSHVTARRGDAGFPEESGLEEMEVDDQSVPCTYEVVGGATKRVQLQLIDNLDYIRPHQHNHGPDVGAATATKIAARGKAVAEDLFKSAAAIVDDVLLEELGDSQCPSLHSEHLARAANRHRQILRPAEYKDMTRITSQRRSSERMCGIEMPFGWDDTKSTKTLGAVIMQLFNKGKSTKLHRNSTITAAITNIRNKKDAATKTVILHVGSNDLDNNKHKQETTPRPYVQQPNMASPWGGPKRHNFAPVRGWSQLGPAPPTRSSFVPGRGGLRGQHAKSNANTVPLGPRIPSRQTSTANPTAGNQVSTSLHVVKPAVLTYTTAGNSQTSQTTMETKAHMEGVPDSYVSTSSASGMMMIALLTRVAIIMTSPVFIPQSKVITYVMNLQTRKTAVYHAPVQTQANMASHSAPANSCIENNFDSCDNTVDNSGHEKDPCSSCDVSVLTDSINKLENCLDNSISDRKTFESSIEHDKCKMDEMVVVKGVTEDGDPTPWFGCVINTEPLKLRWYHLSTFEGGRRFLEPTDHMRFDCEWFPTKEQELGEKPEPKTDQAFYGQAMTDIIE